MTNPQKQLYEFGDFQMDVEERMLSRDGEAITLAPKTFDLLLALVERPGHLLDKDELLRAVWPDAFVEETNLTSNISLLRKALGENGNGQRFIETVPKRGYRFVAPVKTFAESKPHEVVPNGLPASLPSLPEAAEKIPAAKTSFFQRYKKALLATIAIGLLSSVIVFFVSSRQATTTSSVSSKLWRATFEPGLQCEPTWSPDGNFLAFSSDQAGNFDIWVRPAGEGDAVQVTKSPAHDWQPDWSPTDGAIVFRSERDGGGLFVMPALGGSERRIADFGYYPRWSPDGSQILFLDTISFDITESRRIFIVALDGKPPRQILKDELREFSSISGLAWHPDGKRVTVVAAHPTSGISRWTFPLDGGAPVRSTYSTQAEKEFAAAGVNTGFNPTGMQWSLDGKRLYFEGVAQGVRNLWQIDIDPNSLQLLGGLKRLTISPGADRDIRLSRDGKKLAFSVRTETRRLWVQSFDANAGTIKGEAQPLTPEGRDVFHFDVSRDGEKLAYYVEQGGRDALYEKSLTDNSDKLFTPVPNVGRAYPRWSRDGKQLSYRHNQRTNNRIEYAIGTLSAENSAHKVLTNFAPRALFLMTDWTANDQALLGSMRSASANHSAVGLLPLNVAPPIETQARVITENPEYNLWSPRFSPDDKWIVFNAIKVNGGVPSQLFVIPAAGGEWTPITDGKTWSDKPRWSPDGKIIYFVANHAVFLNVWGIRFDPQAGKPVGEPFRVTTLENPGRMLTPQISGMQIGVSANRLIMPVTETSGSVWVLENFAP